MTSEEFRRLALELPEASEGEHQGHPDFRVGGKVFASLGPDRTWGMVRLSPEGLAGLVDAEPDVFEPFPGAWGRQGCTRVRLAEARAATVRRALADAWHARAPRRIVREHGGEES